MKVFYKIFATFGIAWAILIHPLLFFQAIGDQQTRRIQALAAVTKNWMSPAHATNGVVGISEENAKFMYKGHARLLKYMLGAL
jgi:hypothetical protein